MRNKTFDALLDKFKEVHDKKNSDYAEDDNPYSNFEFAAYIAGVTVYEDFLALIGTKIARLRELLKGKIPKNETIQDTFEDLAIYACIMAAYHIDKGAMHLYYEEDTTNIKNALKLITDHQFLPSVNPLYDLCCQYLNHLEEFCKEPKEAHART